MPFYRLLVEMTGINIEAQHGPKRVGDVRLFYFDCSKAERELGWKPEVSFEDGLARTLAWFRETTAQA